MTGDLARVGDWTAYVDALGRETERRWATAGGAKASFTEIAATVLEDVPVPVDLKWATLLEDVVAGVALPPQEDPRAAFGEPPLTLYRGEQFFVSVLFWLDGTTTIHQHSFTGAFRVLSGSSLHVPYDFVAGETVCDQLVLGELAARDPEILRCGDLRIIEYGDAFIHSLFHLERPSVTVLIRTYSDGAPQFNYLPPGLAVDPFIRDNSLVRRFQSLLSLHAIDPTAAFRAARSFIEDANLWAGFLLLMRWCERIDRGASLTDLLEIMDRRYGRVTLDLRAALVSANRASSIVMRRRMLNNQEQRLFLALLLNLPDLKSISRVLSQIYPERQSGDVLAEWVTDLARPLYEEVAGISLSGESLTRLTGALRGGDAEAVRAIARTMRTPELLSPLFV
jgi:hypothetical protein